MNKSKSGGAVFLLLILLLLNAQTATAQVAWGRQDSTNSRNTEAVTKWLSSRAVPLQSIEAGHGSDDLKPLKSVFQNVRIVGLGEDTHGTREFFQFKHRMVEFLIREMGYTVFAMEMSYPAAQEINDYVLNGRGDLDKALANQGLWAWDTNEITGLMRWLRQYNQSAPEGRKVKFVGFDMHNNELSMEAVLSYLRKVAPERVQSTQEVFKLFRATGLGRQHFEYIANVSAPEKERVQFALDELLGFLYLNQTRFSIQTSAAEFEGVLSHARILAQFTDIYRRPFYDEKKPANSSGYTRDFYMAENISRIVEAEKKGTGVVVWAHNEHIGVGVYDNNMGEYLRKRYGDAYYALGTSFNEGGFQARLMDPNVTIGALTGFNVGAAPEGSIEWYFARANLKNFVIDFRAPVNDETVRRWLDSPHGMRSIGLGFAPQSKEELTSLNLKKTFDGLAFIEKTTRARPNPTGMRDAWIIPETK
jgi:erythromycin esterase